MSELQAYGLAVWGYIEVIFGSVVLALLTTIFPPLRKPRVWGSIIVVGVMASMFLAWRDEYRVNHSRATFDVSRPRFEGRIAGPVAVGVMGQGIGTLTIPVAIVNTGQASIARDWSVYVLRPNSTSRETVALAPSVPEQTITLFRGEDESQVALRIFGRELIWGKLADEPLAVGDQVFGWVVGQVRALTQAGLNQRGTSIHITYRDAVGNPYEITYVMP